MNVTQVVLYLILKMKLIDGIFKYLGVVLLFVNTILFTIDYLKNKRTKAQKYFVFYLILTFCVLSLSILLVEVFGIKNNLFLSHFYFIFQFVFLSLFYKELFTEQQGHWVKFIFIIIMLTLLVQYFTDPKVFYRFNLLEIFLTSFPLVIYSIIHLYNSLSKYGKFMYINAAILIYIATSTLIFILGNYISEIDRSIAFNVWFLNKFFYVGYLILILFEWKKSLWEIKD